MSNPTVEVKQGKLEGKISKTPNNFKYFSFKGIPYAKPPVGDLRFTVPTDPEPWDGVRDATKVCNICPQYDKLTQSVVGDEDCLYLNVYTPKVSTDGSLMPVMVFLHGGGFMFGNGTDDTVHGPDYLVEKGVVVVSLNYRIGILGFLSLGLKDAPGNMGLRDQVQALKWVQKNIDQFGGDPKNVTIFGISAGGASVEYLLLSPMAKGLFHRGIAQSGSTLLPWAHDNKIKELAYKIPLARGKVVGADDELLKFLKELPITDLISLSMEVLATKTFRGGIHFAFVPTVEKPGDWEPFLSKKPYDLLRAGEFNKVPYIAGFCTREGLLMVSHSASRLEKFDKEKKFLEFLPFEIDDTEKDFTESKLKSVYLEGKQNFDDKDAYAIDYFSDVDFIGGGYVSATLIAKNHSPVYLYEFAYDGNLNYLKKKYNINREGACHGDDGGYLIRSEVLDAAELSQTDNLVRDRLVEMWTNFAKFGEPTPQLNELLPTKWEPIADTGVPYLYIDKDLTMKENPYTDRVKLFEGLYAKYDLSSS